ncbi:Lin0512 family protein [Hoeflea prorocentri]|uniref:Lin0512 family protein n=1 Tax=Hoeflea prorocentri TaxID=1922333 RepID=A0A9X3UML7_9HYPH|nr:Lin0512 family protein [Hoeflea prorocentri]MCY6383394.1 Lin0512 family protein [Hoeflea prorocentri]MDA5401194.1 Lin0512 family protein [Hoeflea prorocentri]
MSDQKTLKRIMLEMGTGNALHSMDYTRAAIRAVEDATRHSSLTMFRSLGIDPDTMQIELTLAAREPEKINLDAVSKALPYGTVIPKAVKGGLNVMDETSGHPVVIVNAGLVVRVPLCSACAAV